MLQLNVNDARILAKSEHAQCKRCKGFGIQLLLLIDKEKKFVFVHEHGSKYVGHVCPGEPKSV